MPVDDIVVVGTLIRGTQAVGSQTLTVDATTILEEAAGTTNELLASVPQLTASFNGRFEVDPRGFGTGTNTVNKPNLRALPQAGSGATTLVLMDGMRLAPVGVTDSAVDVDIIPSAVLVGIDAVTDGGSSLYGADAVGGVINFRTMRKYEGVKLEANFGFGTKLTSYKEWSGSVTAGKSWATGNAYISVSHYGRTRVQNSDVPWSSGLVYSVANPNGIFASTQCINPVGSVINYFSTGTGFTSNPAAPGAGRVPVGTACDFVGSETYTPRTRRTNVFASVTQEISDTVSLRVTGYWAKRDYWFRGYPVGASTPDAPAPTQATNPTPFGGIVTVQGGTGFSFGANSAYFNRGSGLGFETWGITPELTVKLGGDWQLNTTFHYGRSFNYNRFPSVNQALVNSYIAAGQLNPLNVAAASGAVVNDITDFETATDTKQQLILLRAVADGPLFALPAGDVKLAVGLEYQHNKAQLRSVLDRVNAIDAAPYVTGKRDAKSIFGELQIPVTSFLDVAASGRYDYYSDFGSTFNPSIGATLKPIDGLKIFGHWNTSYNAPTAIDTIGLGSGRLACGIYQPGGTPGTAQRPTDPFGRDTSRQGTCALILTGGRPGGVEPQTAESWAVGFEATPLAGLRFGATYYNIKFENILGAINPANLNTYVTNPEAYIYNVNQADYRAFLDQLSNGGAVLAQRPLASDIAIVVDSRISNLNKAFIEGLDLNLSYTIPTGIGELGFGGNANVPLKAIIERDNARVDELGFFTFPRYSISTYASWKNAGWTVKGTVNIRGPFENATSDYLGNKLITDPFVVTNLFIGYKIEDDDGPLGGTQFRLNVDNLFDVEPERIKLSNTNFPSYASQNWTLGRVIKFGITKEFGGGRAMRASEVPPPPPAPAPVEEVAPPPAPAPVAPPPPPAAQPGERG